LLWVVPSRTSIALPVSFTKKETAAFALAFFGWLPGLALGCSPFGREEDSHKNDEQSNNEPKPSEANPKTQP